MTPIWLENSEALSQYAADHVAALLADKPDAVIAVPTGATPLGLYRRLIALHDSGAFDGTRAHFFNLDEFVGKSADDPRSYGHFLWQHLFRPMKIRPSQVRLLRGDAADTDAECLAFERAIKDVGGLDLAILGLGRNGHIAFNEPGSDWNAGTRLVALTEKTRAAQAVLYQDPAEVPAAGLTMGVATIMRAKAILLLVAGDGKDEAVAALLRGIPDQNWPVTALLDHPNVTVLADRQIRRGTSRNGFAQPSSSCAIFEEIPIFTEDAE